MGLKRFSLKDKVEEIRKLHDKGIPIKEIAKKFNASRSSVYAIIRGWNYHTPKK